MCFLLRMGIFHCYVSLPEGIILPWCCLCYTCCYLLRRGKTGFLLSFFLDKKGHGGKMIFIISPQNDETMSHRESRLLLLEHAYTFLENTSLFLKRCTDETSELALKQDRLRCAISIPAHLEKLWCAKKLEKSSISFYIQFLSQVQGRRL